MNTERLSKVAPPKSSDRRVSPDTVVWHLGLDQIISRTGEIENRIFSPVSEAGSSTFVFDERNVLYSKLRPYLNKVVCPDSIGVATTELVPLRPDPARLDRQYLCYYLRSSAFVSWINSKVSGAKMPRAKMDAFWQHEIPLPPLEDQKRIAYLLSKVEELIAQRKQHLQQLDDLLKSVFFDMFGDPQLNPKRFEIRKLSDFYKSGEGTKCGPFGSALKKSELVDEGIPVWNMDNIDVQGHMISSFRMWISAEKYAQLRSYDVQDGDIVVSRAGTVGKMCVARTQGNPSVISTNLIRVRLAQSMLLPDYFVALMTIFKGRIGRLKTGPDGALTHMSTRVLDSLEFPYPPIELQITYVVVAREIAVLAKNGYHSVRLLAGLYDALSQQAFNGELDLSRIIAPQAKAFNQNAIENGEPMDNHVDERPFPLPAPTDFKKFKTARGRNTILKSWLSAYAKHLGTEPITSESFLELVKQTLSNLESTEDPGWYSHEIGFAEYDLIKDWIFQKLKSEQLTQYYDDEKNQVRVSKAKE